MRIIPSLLFALVIALLSGQSVSRSGIHPEDMDTTCKPCTDFWRYVNGGWLDKNPIPADKSAYGTITVLADANRERVRTILEAAVADGSARPGTDQRKMGDLYASCMETTAIDARGLAPIQADFDRISAVKSAGDLGAVLTSFQQITAELAKGDAGVMGDLQELFAKTRQATGGTGER